MEFHRFVAHRFRFLRFFGGFLFSRLRLLGGLYHTQPLKADGITLDRAFLLNGWILRHLGKYLLQLLPGKQLIAFLPAVVAEFFHDIFKIKILNCFVFVLHTDSS